MLRSGGWINHWVQDLVGAGLAIAIGLCLLKMPPFASWFEHWSYDLPYLLRPAVSAEGVVVVTISEASKLSLQQGDGRPWDRRLHADLLDRLIARGAKAVVFASVFSEPSPENSSDQAFANALRRAHGKVVLAAGSTNGTILLPVFELAAVAPWGLLAAGASDGVVRRLPSSAGYPSLALRLVQMIDRSFTSVASSPWMNYYAPALAVPQVSYELALRGGEPPGVFKGRIVLVGDDSSDAGQFFAPYALSNGHRIGRTEVEATAIMNLLRRDWLFRLPFLYEAGFLAVVGGFLGLAFMGKRRGQMLALAGAGGLLIFALNYVLVVQVRLWFPWMVVAGAQIPVAFGWAWLCDSAEYRRRVRPSIGPPSGGAMLGATFVSEASTDSPTISSDAAGGDSPVVPDHTLVKRIGRGAYGEVWLARDVIGRHHAVKVLKVRSFSHHAPYEREFKGIERFASVSRSHPGLVQVLHVGRNDQSGYFFYIMELADDAGGAEPLNPERYAPKTLASELARRGHLSVRESVEICLALCSALQHLHERQLVHRDIKPANIIFVEGRVKIADIGLVTQIVTDGRERTRLGTEGYLAPEGPGTPQADVYALGKVLYEISMGRDRWQFPEFPTTLGTRPDQADLRRLHEIILTACENDPVHRYQSARAMHEALTRLLSP